MLHSNPLSAVQWCIKKGRGQRVITVELAWAVLYSFQCFHCYLGDKEHLAHAKCADYPEQVEEKTDEEPSNQTHLVDNH